MDNIGTDAEHKPGGKKLALQRLEREGRLDAFKKRQTALYWDAIAAKRKGERDTVLTRTDAFYLALLDFPKLG
jgi:hypothetical protein